MTNDVLFSSPPALARLHRGLGDYQSEDRSPAAGRADARAGTGVGAQIPGGLFTEHARCAWAGAAFSVESKAHRGGRSPAWFPDAPQEYVRRAGAVRARRRYARSRLVVRRHSPG